MADWILDESRRSNSYIAIYDAHILLQGMAYDVNIIFSVGDTRQVVYNKHWAWQFELVSLNTIFSVVTLLTMIELFVNNKKETMGHSQTSSLGEWTQIHPKFS